MKTYRLNSIKWFVVRAYNHFFASYPHYERRWRPIGKRYAGKKLLKSIESNKLIADSIISGKPFMASRFGSTELANVCCGYEVDLGISEKMSELRMKELCTLSGFFPKEETKIKKFSDMMIEMMPEADLMGVWYNPQEDFFIQTKMPNASITYIRGLDAYLAPDPWSKALEGKRVVVVHPFKESILHQYNENREKIFENKDILPEFDLRVVKAVQTVADATDDRFSDWFEALNYMFDEVMSEDFDVAILGCGAYGFPLAAMIKRAGKQAIHLGGATQIMFGIKGGKWDNTDEGKLYNEYWIRPCESEVPKNHKKVENGCYW